MPQTSQTKPGALSKKVLLIVGALAVPFIGLLFIGFLFIDAITSKDEAIFITVRGEPAISLGPLSSTEQVAREVPAPPPAPPTPTQRVGVTLANYDRLTDGMSYSQVVSILGNEGTELSSNNIDGSKTVLYKWDGAGSSGAIMNAIFQNGKLISKAQFGLK